MVVVVLSFFAKCSQRIHIHISTDRWINRSIYKYLFDLIDPEKSISNKSTAHYDPATSVDRSIA